MINNILHYQILQKIRILLDENSADWVETDNFAVDFIEFRTLHGLGYIKIYERGSGEDKIKLVQITRDGRNAIVEYERYLQEILMTEEKWKKNRKIQVFLAILSSLAFIVSIIALFT